MNDVKIWGLGGGLSGDLREDLARNLSPQRWVELVGWRNEGMAFEAQSQCSEFGLSLLAAKGLVGWTDKPAGWTLLGADAEAEWPEQEEHWGERSVKGRRGMGALALGTSRQRLSPAHSLGCPRKVASLVGNGQALTVPSHSLGPPQGPPGLGSQDEHLRSPRVETAGRPLFQKARLSSGAPCQPQKELSVWVARVSIYWVQNTSSKKHFILASDLQSRPVMEVLSQLFPFSRWGLGAQKGNINSVSWSC